MKRTTARTAYNSYINSKVEAVTTINKAKLSFTQLQYLEAKQQAKEQETAQREIEMLKNR